MKKKLEHQRALLEAVIESSEGPIFSVDGEYCYTSFNSAHKEVMKQLYGADIEIGKNILDYHTNPDDRKKAQENIDRALNGESFSMEAFAGDEIVKRSYFLISHNPVKDSTGNVTGVAVYAQDFTSRKLAEEKAIKAEKELIESEEQYHSLFKNNHATMLLINPDNGDIVDVNPAAASFYGYSEEELKRMKITDINVLTDQQVFEEMQKAKKKKKNHFLFKHLLASGEIRCVDTYSGPITVEGKNLLYSIIHDVTERKKAEEDLKDRESSLAEAQRIGHIGSWKWNVQTGELSWSDELYRIYGVDPKTFTPTMSSFAKYVHPDDQETLNNIINQIISEGVSLEFDFRIILDNNSTRVLKTIAEVTEYDEEGNPLIVTGTNQDVTERQRAEEKLQVLLENEKKLAQKLQSANEELQSTTGELKTSNQELMQMQDELRGTIDKLEVSNRELEQFAYVASHDLQEPLRMVGSFTQLLERRYKGQLDEDADDYIGFIVEGSQRMKNLIDDLLAFSRLNTEAKEFEPILMEVALDDILINLQASIKENNAQITHTQLPTINGDPSQINQLLQNLIANAIKFQGNETPQIHITAQEFGKEWLFGVNDNGIGIDPQHQEKIFKIFNRLHTREEYEGTGIGLAICRRIVERHGGRIWVESEPDKGSTFYFTIPKSEIDVNP